MIVDGVSLVAYYFPQDFERGSGKCINDDKAPPYTRQNGHVYSDLKTCCELHDQMLHVFYWTSNKLTISFRRQDPLQFF